MPLRVPFDTKSSIKKALVWLWEHEGSAGKRARGLAAGIFTGCFPVFGLQIVLGVALASLVRGNHLLAAAGTLVSNPITSIPLYWVNYQLGALILGVGPAFPDLQSLASEKIWDLGWGFLSRVLLGSTIVGLASAALVGSLYWLLLKKSNAAGASARRSR